MSQGLANMPIVTHENLGRVVQPTSQSAVALDHSCAVSQLSPPARIEAEVEVRLSDHVTSGSHECGVTIGSMIYPALYRCT